MNTCSLNVDDLVSIGTYKVDEIKLLFVCSRNKRRSLTAEKIFKGRSGINVKSAGTAEGARIKVTQESLSWADHILVMEKNHKNMLRQNFPDLDPSKIEVLGIPDEYEFMDAELVEILECCLLDILQR